MSPEQLASSSSLRILLGNCWLEAGICCSRHRASGRTAKCITICFLSKKNIRMLIRVL